MTYSATIEGPRSCGICSNGLSLVYHTGGPCPYLYPSLYPLPCGCPCYRTSGAPAPSLVLEAIS